MYRWKDKNINEVSNENSVLYTGFEVNIFSPSKN